LKKIVIPLFLLVFLFHLTAGAQTISPLQQRRCGTIQYYEQAFKASPDFKKKFEANQLQLNTKAQKTGAKKSATQVLIDTIPIVIHVVADAALQLQITDAILKSQIDVLNEDFSGMNADSVRIPPAFKPRFGKSKIVFQLAQQNDLGEPSNGIVRVTNSSVFNFLSSDNAKISAKGGSDAWDPAKFLNIWVVNLGTSNVFGISVFPGDPRDINLHGFTCDYRAFGRGASYLFPAFNKGRTTTHELGHFFNLHHIWGDDGGGCGGSDFPDDLAGNDDTPNQAQQTEGNPDPDGIGKIVTDQCSPVPPGIMYQNFMDYSDDVAMVMFTKGQQTRMISALSTSPDRSPILGSLTYQHPVIHGRDARIIKILNPLTSSPQCAVFSPSVIIRNSGDKPLTTLQIFYSLNGATLQVYNWMGNLLPYTQTNVTLPQLSGNTGKQNLVIYTANPNGGKDENNLNDTARVSFSIAPVKPLNTIIEEGFDSPIFPPTNWTIINPDGDITWEWNKVVGKKEPGSASFNDWNNETHHRYDDLVMPPYSFSNKDSVFLTFQLATAIYSNPISTPPVDIDTLSVLLTKDCGNSFITMYKKWGNELQTISNRPEVEFFPSSGQWRKDSLNLSQWLSSSEERFQIYFRFSGNYENNLFIDDVTLYTKVVPEALKEKGYFVVPTVTRNSFVIRHYRKPEDLRFVFVHNVAGQVVWKQGFSGNANTLIPVDLSRNAAGVYFVNLVYADRKITERVIKQ